MQPDATAKKVLRKTTSQIGPVSSTALGDTWAVLLLVAIGRRAEKHGPIHFTIRRSAAF